MKAQLGLLFLSFGTLASAISPCLSKCFTENNLKRFCPTSDYLRLSEEYMLKWKTERNCPAKAKAFGIVANNYLLIAYDFAPYNVTISKASLSQVESNAVCTIDSFEALYKDAGKFLSKAKRALVKTKFLFSGSQPCDLTITDYEVNMADYYETLTSLSDQFSACLASPFTYEDWLSPLPCAPCEPACSEIEVNKWLINWAQTSLQEAIEQLKAVPEQVQCEGCCWARAYILDRITANYDFALYTADSLSFFIFQSTKQLSLTGRKNARRARAQLMEKSSSSSCGSCLSNELVIKSMNTLAAQLDLLQAFGEDAAFCPKFDDQSDQYGAAQDQLKNLSDAIKSLDDQFYINYFLYVVGVCPNE
jgi:hypothetical protein